MDYLEIEENLAYSRVRAVMNAWLGSVAVTLELAAGYPDQLCLPKTGGRYISTCHYSPPQTGHIDFEQTRKGSPGSLVLLAEVEATSLWLCPGNHKIVP